MITKEQIQFNQQKIKDKLAKEKADKENKVNEKLEAKRLGKEQSEKKTNDANDRNDLAVLISGKIKGVISSELQAVIEKIEKVKIDSPEIPKIEIPEIVLPKIELPEITVPEIKIPKIVIPKIATPEIPKIETPVIPEIKIPEIKIPEIKIPKTIIDTNKIIDAVIIGIEKNLEDPLKVNVLNREGRIVSEFTSGGGGSANIVGIKDKDDVQQNPATEDKQDDIIAQGKAYKTLIDDYTTASKTYIGKAVAGANKGAIVWQIKCLDETGNFLEIGFADGVSTFTKEWDNRVGYNYS